MIQGTLEYTLTHAQLVIVFQPSIIPACGYTLNTTGTPPAGTSGLLTFYSATNSLRIGVDSDLSKLVLSPLTISVTTVHDGGENSGDVQNQTNNFLLYLYNPCVSSVLSTITISIEVNAYL